MGENCKKTPTEQHKMCMKSEFSVSMWNRVGEQKKLEVVEAKEECAALSIHLQLSIPGESWNKDYGTDERWLEAFSLPASFEWPAVQVNTTFRNLMLLWYETTKKTQTHLSALACHSSFTEVRQYLCLDSNRQNKSGQAQIRGARSSSYKRSKYVRSERKQQKKFKRACTLQNLVK